jgi:co-chaperonin GroES (HSP10)
MKLRPCSEIKVDDDELLVIDADEIMAIIN